MHLVFRGFEQAFVLHDGHQLPLEIPSGRVLGYTDEQDAFSPAFLHEHLQREKCQKRDVKGGQPLLFAVLDYLHAAGRFRSGGFCEEEVVTNLNGKPLDVLPIIDVLLV